MTITIGLPSKGRMKEDSSAVLARAGFTVAAVGNDRSYRGRVEGRDDIEIAFLSASEISREIANGTVVGSSLTSVPYTTTWTPTAPGSYLIVAEALDNSGNVTNSTPITLTVIANLPPVVSMRFPTNNYSTIAGTTISLSANASDSDGSVAQVRFFVNGALVPVDGGLTASNGQPRM